MNALSTVTVAPPTRIGHLKPRFRCSCPLRGRRYLSATWPQSPRSDWISNYVRFWALWAINLFSALRRSLAIPSADTAPGLVLTGTLSPTGHSTENQTYVLPTSYSPSEKPDNYRLD